MEYHVLLPSILPYLLVITLILLKYALKCEYYIRNYTNIEYESEI